MKEAEYNPMISDEIIADIQQKYPFDAQSNMNKLFKKRSNVKMTKEKKNLEQLPGYLDGLSGLLGKDVVERLQQRIPFVELEEKIETAMKTLC